MFKNSKHRECSVAKRFLYLYIFLSIIYVTNSSGHEYTYAPNCENANSPLILTEAGAQKNMYFVLQLHTPKLYRRRFTLNYAVKAIGTDPLVDFRNRKTMVFMDGYLDSEHLPFARVLIGHFAAMGYNIIAPDAQSLYSQIYPKAVRVSYQVSNVTATLLRDLMKYGLRPKDITIAGVSLGGQTVAMVAKYYTRLTGKKIKQIFSMDPAGPCHRSMPPEYRLSPNDAEKVLAIHTAVDGFGMGEALGHVDFYVNGGEWQQFLYPYQPWHEDFFGHVISMVYLYTSLFIHPNKFLGVKCQNVQQAREHKCYDNYPQVTNVMGFNTDYNKPGIYYIPVSADAPLYAPDDWLKKKLVYPVIYNDAMSDVEHFVLIKRHADPLLDFLHQ